MARATCFVKQLVNFDAADAGDKKGANGAAKKRGRVKNVKISDDSPAVAKAAVGDFTSEVLIKGLPEALQDLPAGGKGQRGGPDRIPANSTEIIITDDKGEQYSQNLCCLFCDKVIED